MAVLSRERWSFRAAEAVCISPYHFTRLFKYVVDARVRKVKELLTTGKFTISEAAHHVRFRRSEPPNSSPFVALHIPITAMLIGIVLRGSAFIFRKYDSTDDAVQRWSSSTAWEKSETALLKTNATAVRTRLRLPAHCYRDRSEVLPRGDPTLSRSPRRSLPN